jgi:hypothetical protein
MFDRLRKAFTRHPDHASPSGSRPSGGNSVLAPVSEWAATQGFGFSQTGTAAFGLEGQVGGKSWRMEVGRPSRKYIQGEELRARADLGLHHDGDVVVMSRPLKEQLAKQAYEHYTDDVQTTVGATMPEEVRWLAMFDEVGWDSLPRVVWTRYSVITDAREHALAWIDPLLAQQLLDWPAPAPGPDVPFMLMLLRGKVYLRMQQAASQLPVLQHAAQVLASACENALGTFPKAR